ncbi:MAG: glycosyltransferase family 39 protein [Candidatus Goldbacteria bacterium]|nr:glycosyltransferase family 39 protein [Candidatus Goldiibacteriota bacterium]
MNRKEFILFTTIVVIGVFLRFFGIGSQSVWIDEYITADFANENNILKTFISSYANDPHPPLYYMLVHIFMKLFGTSEMSLRFVSFLFGVINIFIVYKLCRSFFSQEISFITLIFFTFSSYNIYYSQEARMYTMFLTFSLLIVYYFIISVKYNYFTEKSFVAFSILGLYTHTYTILLLVILNLLYFIKYREDIRQELWIKANLAIAIFAIPLIPFYVKTLLTAHVSHRMNMFIAPFLTFKSFMCGLTIGLNVFTILTVLIFLLLIVIAVISNRRYKEKKVIEILLYISLLFVLIPWVESLFGKPVYSDRTLIPVSVFFIIILSVGVSYLFRSAKIFVVVLYLLINLVSLYNYYFVDKYRKIDYKKFYETISENYKKNEVIIHTHVTSYASFEYYNKIKYKTGFQDRYISEIPEYKGGFLKMQMREAWRKFNNFLNKNLKTEIYAGYDKNILTNDELTKTISNYDKIYFIIDDKKGFKQIELPQSHLWYSNSLPYKERSIDDFERIKNNFNIEKTHEIYGSKLFILVKKK